MSVNRIDATLTDDQRDRANTALAALAKTLPFLIDLSAKDRADSPKFGDKHRPFAVEALTLAEAPQTCSGPASISRNSAPTCDWLRHSTPCYMPSRPSTASSPTPTLPPGSEAYAAALQADQYAKLHPVATGALEDSLDDLGRRFARKTNKTTPPA